MSDGSRRAIYERHWNAVSSQREAEAHANEGRNLAQRRMVGRGDRLPHSRPCHGFLDTLPREAAGNAGDAFEHFAAGREPIRSRDAASRFARRQTGRVRGDL